MFRKILCCFLTLSGLNDLTYSQTYKYCIVQICFISYFTLIMRMGKKAKFSPYERKFVCQHEMASDCKTVIRVVQHILHGGL